MFQRIDDDNSGKLSKQEILNIYDTDMRRLSEALGVKGPLEVFEALDIDGSGQVSITEFFDGVQEIALSRTPVDALREQKQVDMQHWRIKELFNKQHDLMMK